MHFFSKRHHVCILFLSLFLFCTKPDTDTVILAVGGAPSEFDFWEKVAADCKGITGITLELIRQPTDTDQRRQNLVTALRAKKPTPDIFLMDVAWIAQFAASDWLEPLQSRIESSGISKELFFEPVVKETDIHNGDLIALPVYVDGGLLYYRADLLEKYGYTGPPRIWDELVRCAVDISEKERMHTREFTGFLWQGAQYEGLTCTFLEFSGSNNGGIDLSGSGAIIDNPNNRQAAQFMQDLIHKHKISPPNTFTDMKEEEVRLAFQNGNALFERNWPYAWKLHQEKNSPVAGKIGIALLPHFENGRPVSTLGGWHIGLSRYSKNKDKAVRCISYLLSADIQKKFVTTLGWNSGRIDIYDDPDVLEAMPHAKELREVFHHSIARPVVPHYSYMSSVIQRYVNALLSRKMDIQEAFTQSEAELVKIVHEYGKGIQ